MNFFVLESRKSFNLRPQIFVGRRKITALVWTTLFLLIFAIDGFSQETDDEGINTDDAIKIFNLAQDAHEKGALPDALKLYDEALKIAPEFPEAEYQKGNALLSLKKLAEAEKSFRRAIELRADWTLPMISLGSILIDKNQFAEAEKILNKAIEFDEKNFPAYVALTELRLKTKATPGVLKELLSKLQILSSKANPTASVWVSRASLERALGDAASAKTSLSRALAIEPKNKSALMEFAGIAVSESDYSGALKTVQTILQISPDFIDAKILQARILAANGNPPEAMKVLDSIENKTAEIGELRATITASSSVDATELEKQLDKDAKNPAVLGQLCTLLRTKNPTKALDFCRRAIEAEPSNVNHAVGFGAALVQAKQYDMAVAVYKRILEISPDIYTAHANLATALFQLKRYPEAISEYQWLTEKQPDTAATYYFLAIAHDNLAKYPDAMANYQQFLKLADANADRLEIEKVNLRLPVLQKQIKEKKGKK